MDSSTWLRTCLCAAALAAPTLACAEDAAPETFPSDRDGQLLHAVGASALVRSLDTKDLGYGAQLDYRLKWPSEYQLGATASLLHMEADRIAGYAVEDTRRIEAAVLSGIPLGRTGPLALDLRSTLSYADLTSDDESSPEDHGSRVGLELAVIGNVSLSPRLAVRLGFVTPFALEVAPSGELATQGALLLAGLGFAITDSLLLRGDVESGGTFGFDGDGTKYETRVNVGVRWVSGRSARSFNGF